MPVYENIKTPTPVYAAVGAGDLVVEKLRDASTDAQDRFSKLTFEPKKLQADANQLRIDVQDKASERVTKVTDDFKSYATDVREVPNKAQATVNDFISQAGSTYDDLAARGKELIEKVREQQESFDLQEQVKKTVDRVKGASPLASSKNGSAPAKKPATKSTAKKSTAKKSTARKSTAQKSTAKKSPAKKATQ